MSHDLRKEPLTVALALLGLLLLGLLACRAQVPQAAPQPTPVQADYADYFPENAMVHQSGKMIIGLNGQPLRLRGVNLGGWLLWEGWEYGRGLNVSETAILDRLDALVGPAETASFRDEIYANFVTAADIQRIAVLGFNSVRVPINAKVLEDDDHPYVYKASGWALIDNVLDWCEASRVYAILDLHSVPGGQSRLSPSDPQSPAQLIWRSPDNQDRTVALWKAIAARYRERSIVAGYDLINEPLPPKGEDLVSLYARIIPAIRQVDPYHMLIVEGGKFSSDFSMFATPFSGNQAYGFHMYTWLGDNRAKSLARIRAVSDAQNIPLWAGEFGENTYEMIGSTVAMYEDPGNEVNGGWSFWTWKKVPGRFPALVAVDVPEDWRAVIEWIGDPKHAPQPSQEQALVGMRQFAQAVRLENTHLDERMLAALRQGVP